MLPPTVSAHTCCAPQRRSSAGAGNVVNRGRYPTKGGLATLSWPLSLMPQQNTEASLNRAQENAAPCMNGSLYTASPTRSTHTPVTLQKPRAHALPTLPLQLTAPDDELTPPEPVLDALEEDPPDAALADAADEAAVAETTVDEAAADAAAE